MVLRARDRHEHRQVPQGKTSDATNLIADLRVEGNLL